MKIISRKQAKDLGLKRYFTGKPCKYDHVDERLVSNGDCVTCGNLKRKLNYESNKESIAKRQTLWRQNNQKKLKSDRKRYYIENKDKIKEYRKKNKEKIRAQYRNRIQYYKDYYERNPLYAFVRSTLRRIERASGNGISCKKNEGIVGYTQEEFIAHIESKFKDGMSWNNRTKWHIDHIKPVSLFIKEGITDPAVINALSNLQPLWAEDNLAKGDKY